MEITVCASITGGNKKRKKQYDKIRFIRSLSPDRQAGVEKTFL
jgi:hypothetical protein